MSSPSRIPMDWRRRDQRPGSEIPITYLAQSQPESQSWRSSHGGQPGLRKAAAGASAACRQPSHSIQRALVIACRMTASQLWRHDHRIYGDGGEAAGPVACSTRVTRRPADLGSGPAVWGSDAFSGVTANPAVGYAADSSGARGRDFCFQKSPRFATSFTC